MPFNLLPDLKHREPRLGINEGIAVSDVRQGTDEIVKVRCIGLPTRVEANPTRLEVTDDLRPRWIVVKVLHVKVVVVVHMSSFTRWPFSAPEPCPDLWRLGGQAMNRR